eukprot:3776834-Prymnesium_polylepis.1
MPLNERRRDLCVKRYATECNEKKPDNVLEAEKPFHRHQRWQKVIKEQKSEEKLYDKIRQMKTDSTPL